jgi:hypothetical protein
MLVTVEDATAFSVPEDHATTLKNCELFFGLVSPTAELSSIWGRVPNLVAAE